MIPALNKNQDAVNQTNLTNVSAYCSEESLNSNRQSQESSDEAHESWSAKKNEFESKPNEHLDNETIPNDPDDKLEQKKNNLGDNETLITSKLKNRRQSATGLPYVDKSIKKKIQFNEIIQESISGESNESELPVSETLLNKLQNFRRLSIGKATEISSPLIKRFESLTQKNETVAIEKNSSESILKLIEEKRMLKKSKENIKMNDLNINYIQNETILNDQRKFSDIGILKQSKYDSVITEFSKRFNREESKTKNDSNSNDKKKVFEPQNLEFNSPTLTPKENSSEFKLNQARRMSLPEKTLLIKKNDSHENSILQLIEEKRKLKNVKENEPENKKLDEQDSSTAIPKNSIKTPNENAEKIHHINARRMSLPANNLSMDSKEDSILRLIEKKREEKNKKRLEKNQLLEKESEKYNYQRRQSATGLPYVDRKNKIKFIETINENSPDDLDSDQNEISGSTGFINNVANLRKLSIGDQTASNKVTSNKRLQSSKNKNDSENSGSILDLIKIQRQLKEEKAKQKEEISSMDSFEEKAFDILKKTQVN